MTTTTAVETTVAPPSRRGVFAVLSVVSLIALVFIAAVAMPYFSLTQEQFRSYWPRRWWLLLHIGTGIVALLSGPVQLWLGLADRRMQFHRRLGAIYMVSVGISSVAAYYLAFNTDFGWVFGAGLGGLATAWVITTGLAFVAIRRHLYEQHKEWMIRSYVVTTAFVTFRLFFTALESAGVGSLNEQLTAASWFCWAVPLLVTEGVLQGRKILAVKG